MVLLRWLPTKMDFSIHLIQMIMQCISSVRFQILVNGKPLKQFIPSRDLRQGDSLSPYLFILCIEGLSSLIKRAVSHGLWSGFGWGGMHPNSQCFKLFSLMPCWFSNFLRSCVMSSVQSLGSSGGVQIGTQKGAWIAWDKLRQPKCFGVGLQESICFQPSSIG